MTTDRELLELAAKAAGMNSHRWNGSGMFMPIHPEREGCGSVGPIWNPLSDDGDALRLAVKLVIHVTNTSTDAWASQVAATACEPIHSDAYSATRRAIVRAADEIGRNMP